MVALAAASVAAEMRAADPVWVAVAPHAAPLAAGPANRRVGLAVGVLRGESRRVLGFGQVQTPVGKRTPDGRTVFEIGSITKAFTGVLLADAVRRGEVTLDAPANTYLPPDLRLNSHADRPITLLDLATHRGGLPRIPPNLTDDAADLDNPYADFSRPRLAAALKAIHPERPGRREEYSNLGAGLIGDALVHAAKLPSYDALVRARIGTPLGLADTAEALTGAQRSRLASGMSANRKPVPGWDFATMEAAGGLRSTPDDMLTFAAANLGRGPADVVAACKGSHTKRRGRVGLLWHHTTLPKSKAAAVWHNGGTGGFWSMLVIVPDRDLAVVALCAADVGPGVIDAVALQAADALSTPPKVAPRPPAK